MSACCSAPGSSPALGQWLLTRLTTGNGIEITAAIWFQAGRMPALQNARQRGAVDRHRRHGRAARPRRRAQTVRRRVRQPASRPAEALGRTAPPHGRDRRRRRHGRRLQRAARRRPVRARSAARSAGAAAGHARARRLAHRQSRRRASSSPTRRSTPFRSTPSRPMSTSGRSSPRRSSACGRSCSSGRSHGPIASVRPAGGVWSRRRLVLAVVGLLSIVFPELLGNGQDVAQLLFLHPLAPVALAALLFCCGRSRPSPPPRAARRAACSRPRSPPAR